MEFREETIQTEEIYRGKIINLRIDKVRLPDGRRSTREIVEHPGGVTIIPLINDEEIILVEQFRKPSEKTLLELPAGKLEKNEEPIYTAKRELIEETGYSARNWDYLLNFYTSPGFADEILYLFLARGLEEVGIDPDDDEIIKIHRLPVDKIMEEINSGRIQDGKTILGLQYFLLMKSDF